MFGSFTEQVGNVNVSAQLDRWGIGSPWSDEPSAINVGLEYRKDAVQFDPDEFSKVGDIAGFGEEVFPIHSSIEAKEIFAVLESSFVSVAKGNGRSPCQKWGKKANT